jgi:phosphoglycerate dehydrogenase-like enzyme
LLRGLYILDNQPLIYASADEEIRRYVDFYAEPQTRESIAQRPSLLSDAEVVFSGWGSPVMDEAFLQSAPHLKAVFYGAGSIKSIVTEAFWERNIRITSAFAANAVPVVEYTISQILFSLKCGWYYASMTKKEGRFPPQVRVAGAYGSTVGIISLGMVGRKVCDMLRHFDVRVIAYDPFVSKEDADRLRVELVSLEELFRRSDVVSLHTPWLKETEGMITGEHFDSMKSHATFINTARGAIVKEEEMIAALQRRPDVYAILDVTHPEPPVDGSPLYTLANVVLTPHIAGSLSAECNRMGEFMLQELKRYVEGKPFKWEITKEKAMYMA